ncbi:MAG: DNA polymerase III subunit beta, partial [Paludibacteraceae bacterium]|nr:DNA polymerase III subunit beta [Paludibacteraceae bacterium]
IVASLLSERLQILTKILPSKPSTPIIGYFLFELDGNVLTVTATDGDTTLVSTLAVAEAQENGRAAIMAKNMDIIHELKDQLVSFQVNPSSYKVNLESETGKYEFVGASADEYPQHRALSDEAVTLEAPAQLLAEGISQTSFAVAPTEDMRPIMGGLYFDATTGNGLNIVATDAHKLARFHMDDITVSEPSAFVMPAKPANVLRTLLGSEGDARISVRFDGNAIYCKTSKYWILTRQIEGKYPAYSAVIPTSNPIEVIVDRAQLLSAVRRVDVCSAGANLTRFKISKGSLLIATQDIDYSLSGQETLPCQYDGDEVEIGLKATLVKEMLGILTSQDVMIQMSDSAHPGLFVPYQKKDGCDVLMLLMPMMLS